MYRSSCLYDMMGKQEGLFLLTGKSGVGKSNLLLEILIGSAFFRYDLIKFLLNFSDHSLNNQHVVLLSQEMKGSDLYHQAIHQIAEASQTMTSQEAKDYIEIFDKLKFFLRPKGEAWDLNKLKDFFDEEINSGATVFGIDHQRLLSGEFLLINCFLSSIG